ncbi:MAG TPA: NDP-sugar synthase [Miltoncostaeaceae bacterium]|nr:NDP-sugar synthase [Miltoncostaeaceae bacterium]
MRAIILVGGEGRRLRPLTDTRPKPMMPLVDRPFVAHQLDLLRRHGIRDVIFSCGYRPDALRDHFGDGAAFGMRLRYVVDPQPLGTAGAVANAIDLLDDDPVLVLNGDILTDLDLTSMITRHRDLGAHGTIALTPVEDPSAFGLVRLRPGDAVEEFVEKPRGDQLRPGEPFRINAGTYVLERELIEMIPRGVACSIEREIFPAAAEAGHLFGYPSGSYWRDIGTPASYLAASHDVLAGRIETDAPADGAYVGPSVRLGRRAQVDELSCLGAAAAVGYGARIETSVVGSRALVGEGACLSGAIVGARVSIGAGASIEEGAVIGDGASIGAGVRIDGRAPVPTGARVE